MGSGVAMDDPYKVLDVDRRAGEEDIRRAYRRLAKRHHPDLNPGKAEAEQRFKEISAAYALLSDPEKRARYDRGEIDASGAARQPEYSGYRGFAEGPQGAKYGPGGRSEGRFRTEDLSDLFTDLFGDFRQAGGPGKEAGIKLRGSDRHVLLHVGFLDAVNGTKRRLQTAEGRTFEIAIPPGTEDGRVLRLAGQGGPGLGGGPPGDALVEIRVDPHPVFRRVGDDIHVDMAVTLAQAALGGKIAVQTRTGPVTMTIPEGSDTGRVLRLRGKGVPAHAGRPGGDQYVTLKIVLGSMAHDPALREFLRRRAGETETAARTSTPNSKGAAR